MVFMEITVLGSGTSGGIPEPGCTCPVCRSDNPKNKRTRCSVLVRSDNISVLIDTATEFRLQAIRENIDHIDAVLLTHTHADHVSGLDDIRNFTRRNPVPVYGSRETIREIRERFGYIFRETQTGGGKPRIILSAMDSPVDINGLTAEPIPVRHGNLDVLAYRIGGFAYATDCNSIPEESLRRLKDLDLLIIDGLKQTPHETHFSIPEALEIIRILKPKKALLTHFCHRVDHAVLEKELPDNVEPAYDGLKIII